MVTATPHEDVEAAYGQQGETIASIIMSVMDYGRACADELEDSKQMWLDDIRERLEKFVQHAYAEGHADERESVAQLCDEEATRIRKEGEGCKDGRYDWMADGIEALADTLRGIDTATGVPADPVLAAGWLPIESAPEDENILVATQGGHVDTAFWTDEDGEGRKWWWLVSANEYAKHPLHPNLIPLYWMPLPKHPHRVATTIGKAK
jgi:hypothetical protein